MLPVIATAVPMMAIGYSLIYLLLGGGVGGAALLFVVAKLFRR